MARGDWARKLVNLLCRANLFHHERFQAEGGVTRLNSVFVGAEKSGDFVLLNQDKLAFVLEKRWQFAFIGLLFFFEHHCMQILEFEWRKVKTNTMFAGSEGLGKPAGFNFDRWWGMEGQHRPYLHTLYGLWLYGNRSADWGVIKEHWPAIKRFYSANSAKAEIFGEFGAHIAVARLARQFGDAMAEKEAVANALKCFADGLDYAAIEKRSLKYFNRLKEQHHNVLRSTNFMLMNLTPEVGRYLRENLKDVVMAKNEAIKKSYPHWWFIAPPYASWAGNIGPDCEANGLPREIFGMIYPVERWVNEAKGQTLAGYMTSAPDGVGDCFWLEGLVGTIEAYGEVKWDSVKTR